MCVCLCVCVFVPKDLVSRWTDWVLLEKVDSHGSRYKTIFGEGTTIVDKLV